MRTLTILGLVLSTVLVVTVLAGNQVLDDTPSSESSVSQQSVRSKKSDDRGEELSRTYCASCHVRPEPEHLDKSTWLSKVFPLMRTYMGLDPVDHRERLQHDVLSFYPAAPMMSEDDWFTVASWYIDAAPDTMPLPPLPDIADSTSLFTAEPLDLGSAPPMVTFTFVDEATSRLVFGDGIANALHVHKSDGQRIVSIPMLGPPSSLSMSKGDWYVTDMAKLLPHDSAAGRLYRIQWKNGNPVANVVLDSLRRPVHVVMTDINGDGRDDALICEYGNLLGRFGWYDMVPGKRPVYHELIGRPGAIRAEVVDLNGDGKKDIVVQLAQARESITAFFAKGKGRFEERELLSFPPSFGSSSFRCLDEDGDGRLDLLVTFGDNGDYDAPPLKPYHGIALYRQTSTASFERAWFLPMNGAYGAYMVDFDLDGDNDILARGYFPPAPAPAHDLVRFYEKTTTGWKLSTLPQATLGRWLVGTSGDVDGDGDIDILLGNVSMGPGVSANSDMDVWTKPSNSVLLLRNRTRKP